MRSKIRNPDWYTNWKRPVIEHAVPTKYGYTVLYPEKLTIGLFVDIARGVIINAEHGVMLNSYVQIGFNTVILSASTIDDKIGGVVLLANARVGANCTIMPGITIGENSIVGANSFVNKNIPDNETWVGVPAKRRK